MFACLYRPPAPDVFNRGEPSAPSAVSLATIAEQFSPRYECRGADLVSIDASGLDRLLGPPEAIAGEMRRDAAARGVRAHVAVAPTRTAAMVLAMVGPGITVVARGGEAAALAPVAIGILERMGAESAADAVAAFRRWGLKTLGDVAALPPADLAARLGRPALAFQAIARGEDIGPLVPTLAEERFDASLDLEWPIEELEPLSFVLTRLLEPLSLRLERRDRGAAALHVLLRLVTREVYARRLELPSPMRDVRTLRTLALLDLETHPPGAGIDRVTVVIDPTPGRIVQHTLFARAHPTPEQLSTLAARLGALMGQDRFGAPAAVDSYRPGAFRLTPFAAERETTAILPPPAAVSAVDRADAATALRRCRHAVPARVAVVDGCPARVTTERRGFAGGAVVRAAGPWRTSGSWWVAAAHGETGDAGRGGVPRQVRDAGESAWDRDEWDVSLSDGAMYRVFRDRSTDAWFIDGVVD